MDVGYMTRFANSNFNLLNPQKAALKFESGETWSYKELNEKANMYGNKLRELGIKKGDRVGVLLHNCLEYFALYFGIAKIGAIAVRLNFRLKSQEFDYLFNDSNIKVLCFHSNLTKQIDPIRKNTSIEHYISFPYEGVPIPEWADPFDILESGSKEEIVTDNISGSDPVMLMYTSGTTGHPKGAVWTHDSTLWFAAMQSMKWGIDGKEIAMTTGPLYHVGAMEDLALPVLLRGGTVIITKSKGFSIERILHVIEQEGVTDIFLFPFMIYDMLQSPSLNNFKLTKLNRIFTGGDPLVPWAIEQLNNKFPNIGLVQVYGLTEGTPVAASLDPEDTLLKSHTVGKPLPLTEIKLINDDEKECEVNEVGEILIKSPVVSKEYWNKIEETQKTFKDGWCRTGDLGKMDEDGYLTIAGRKKDMIRSGGENIYAAEIEDVIIRNEKVKDVAIIGIPHPKYLETVCAVVVKKDESLTEEELINYCDSRLANYKKPKKVIFTNELPRTPSGKVQKFILRDKYKSERVG